MSGGPYHQFYHGHDEEDIKSRLAAIERNISDIYNLLGGNSGLISTADDAELTALMAGQGLSAAQVQRGLDGVATAQAMQPQGVSRAEVRRMMEEVLVEIAMTVRPLGRAEVQKMIDDAMVSVIMD